MPRKAAVRTVSSDADLAAFEELAATLRAEASASNESTVASPDVRDLDLLEHILPVYIVGVLPWLPNEVSTDWLGECVVGVALAKEGWAPAHAVPIERVLGEACQSALAGPRSATRMRGNLIVLFSALVDRPEDGVRIKIAGMMRHLLAVAALTRAEQQRMLPPLRALVSDRSVMVRKSAVKALVASMTHARAGARGGAGGAEADAIGSARALLRECVVSDASHEVVLEFLRALNRAIYSSLSAALRDGFVLDRLRDLVARLSSPDLNSVWALEQIEEVSLTLLNACHALSQCGHDRRSAKGLQLQQVRPSCARVRRDA